MKNETGTAGVSTTDFDVRPMNPSRRPQSGAQSLCCCFFGGEASGVVYRWIGTGVTVGDFVGGEGALYEAFGMPSEQLADAGHLDKVDSGASDHFAG